jgi:hypothetical protein
MMDNGLTGNGCKKKKLTDIGFKKEFGFSGIWGD